MHYFPLAWPLILALLVILIIVAALFELRVLAYAYERIGISHRHIFGILLLTFVGSAVNVPVAELPPEEIVSGRVVQSYGSRYVVPVVHEWPRTIIAVNVGGALIPIILSIYLLVKNKLYFRGTLAILVVVVITHLMAHPLRGVGITVPIFIPPLAAAAAALALAWRRAAPLAYIAGSMGTLIGADLLNLGKVRGLGAPIASIGGAGTFDGVFLAGIIAVLLSSIAPAPRPDPKPQNILQRKIDA